jgi:hypothetical protein
MLAIFTVPVLFITIMKIAYSKEKLEQLRLRGLEEAGKLDGEDL